jgi:uncharacterized protein YbjT (DUF2867 family)
MNTKPAIFIAGATGLLGAKLVDAALKKNNMVRALVRDLEPSDGEKEKQLADWVSQGVEPVVGDVMDRESLLSGIQGADIVISAVGNVEPILDMGQKNLIYACKAAGVKRFVPSDFSVDYFKADLGDNYNLDYRITTFAFLKASGVPWTSVLNGAFTEVQFTDFVGLLDQKAGTFSYWGDGETPCDFTLTDDAAAYTIAAALDPKMQNRVCRVAGDVLSMKGVKSVAEKVLDRPLQEVCRGSVDDLRDWIAEKKRAAMTHDDYLAAQYHWMMVSGKGKLEPLDNGRYPDIRPVGVEAYLRNAFL